MDGLIGYLNHSCGANSYTPMTARSPGLFHYDQTAVRRIEPGDEITCDYDVFDYEFDVNPIDPCGCKSTECRGVVKGFKHLALEAQVR